MGRVRIDTSRKIDRKTAKEFIAKSLEERTRIAQEVCGCGWLIDPELECLEDGLTGWPFQVLILEAYMGDGWVWIPESEAG